MTHQPDRRETLLFLALLAAGLLVVQLLWLVRSSAPEHPGVGYEPRDMERQRYLEERPER